MWFTIWKSNYQSTVIIILLLFIPYGKLYKDIMQCELGTKDLIKLINNIFKDK